MTLTRLIPSLRTTIPDPLDIDFWPEATVATTTDVIVSGLSLLRLVEVCGTPCVHSGSAVIPGSLGRPSETHKTAVLVVRVLDVQRHGSGHPVIRTDARLGDLRLVWSELRLINRASTAKAGTVLVSRSASQNRLASSDDVSAVDLPLDLRTGDLLAIPSLPLASTWAIQPHPLTGTFDPGPGSATPADAAPTPSVPSWLSHLA